MRRGLLPSEPCTACVHWACSQTSSLLSPGDKAHTHACMRHLLASVSN